MNLSEYIRALQHLEAAHGGSLDVQKWLPAKGRHDAGVPALAYKRAYDRSGARLFDDGHGVPHFYNPEHDNPVQKGDPVIRV